MASGDTLAILIPESIGPPPASNHAPYVVIVAATGRRGVLLYSPTTGETAIWPSLLARSYAGGGITIDIYGAMALANTGTKKVRLDVALERVPVGAVLGVGGSDFAAAKSVSAAVDNLINVVFKATVTFTNGAEMDSVVGGDPLRLRVSRDPDNVDDDALGDYQFARAEIRET